jgi:hypothetical protein
MTGRFVFASGVLLTAFMISLVGFRSGSSAEETSTTKKSTDAQTAEVQKLERRIQALEARTAALETRPNLNWSASPLVVPSPSRRRGLSDESAKEFNGVSVYTILIDGKLATGAAPTTASHR